MIACMLVLVLQDPAEAARLQAAVDEARRELEAETLRIRKEDALQEAELAAAKAERARAADAWLEQGASLAKAAKELEALRAERAALRPAVSTMERSAEEIRRVQADMARKLGDLLRVLPPAETRPEQESRLAKGDVADLLAVSSSLLRESSTRATFSRKILNAEGVEEEATLFRAGMILHAYRGDSSGGLGLALAAPSGDAGWRWDTRLPGWGREALAAALQGGGDHPLPLDVTRQLARDRRRGPSGAWEFILAGGPVMVPMGLAALLALLLTIERLGFLMRQGSGAERLAREVLADCVRGDGEAAERRASEGRTPLARTLAACLRRRGSETSALEDAVQEQILHELPRLERFLPVIGILAGVAPMLGLLGTVTGMMGTFDRITALGSGDPGIMAGGIYEALITTVAGLVLAIPLLLVHGHLGSRVDRIVADLERYSASLVNLLRKDHGPAA
jgi:biopolymer transport protein ExbB